MKKFISTGLLFWAVISLMAQNNPIDELFDKYSEKEGFTSVYISGKMFGFLAGDSKTETGERNLFSRLKSIRILSVEDSLLNKNINFYDELSPKLNLKTYEEMMVIKEGKENTRFLLKQNGDIITELLMISGGPGNNSLIMITGDLDLKTISEISKSYGINEMKTLENLENTKYRK